MLFGAKPNQNEQGSHVVRLRCAAVACAGCMVPAVAHQKEKGTAISGMVVARKKPPMPRVTSTSWPASCGGTHPEGDAGNSANSGAGAIARTMDQQCPFRGSSILLRKRHILRSDAATDRNRKTRCIRMPNPRSDTNSARLITSAHVSNQTRLKSKTNAA
jgi:hypothetical protein